MGIIPFEYLNHTGGSCKQETKAGEATVWLEDNGRRKSWLSAFGHEPSRCDHCSL